MNLKTRVAGLAILACAGLCQAQIQVVVNGSFETAGGDGSLADQWIQFGNAYREAFAPRTGDNNMSTFGTFTGGFNVTGFFQDYPAGQGDTFAADAYIEVLSADPVLNNGFAVLNIEWHDFYGNMISYISNTVANSSTPLDTWVKGTTAGAAPAGTVTARVVALFFQYDLGDTGSVKWDDVSVTRDVACLADVNHDHIVDLADFFDFFNSFDVGCPGY